MQKVVSNPDGSNPVATKFIYDGWNLLAELDSNNNVIRSYMWGSDLGGSLSGAGGVGGLLELNVATSGTHFTVYDANGNITALIMGDGTPSAQYEYSPFGETLRASGSVAQSNPCRFSTKYADGEADLIYYGFRYYNSTTGRWPSRDPLSELGGPNLYSFLGNHPVNSYDVFGLYEEAGHFYTIYAVARAAGLSANEAFTYAYYAQVPDEVPGLDAFSLWKAMSFGFGDFKKPVQGYIPEGTKIEQWAEPVMTLLHSLHGGGKNSVLNRRQCLLNLVKEASLKPWERGLILHAFGDAYAHLHGTGDKLQAYPYPNGHGVDSLRGKDPDLISNYPDRYKDYVNTLYKALAGSGANPDLLNKILSNATALSGSHEKQNSAMASFVQGRGFGYSTLPEPYRSFRPEGGKKLLPKDPAFPTPTASEVQALMDRIRKACCAEKK